MSHDTQKISLIKDFNMDAVLAHFFLSPTMTSEAEAMRFVYQQMYANPVTYSTNRATRAQEAVSRSIEKIELPYSIAINYADDFFKKHGLGKKPALCSVIIGDLMSNSGDPSEEPPTPNLSNALIDEIVYYNNEAQDLVGGYFSSEFSVPSLFLAAVKNMMYLDDLNRRMDDLELDDLVIARTDNLKIIKQFINGFKMKNDLIMADLRGLRKDTKVRLDEKIDAFLEVENSRTPPPRESVVLPFRPLVSIDQGATPTP